MLGVVYASHELIQVANVATPAGHVTASYAMPDLHLGTAAAQQFGLAYG